MCVVSCNYHLTALSLLYSAGRMDTMTRRQESLLHRSEPGDPCLPKRFRDNLTSNRLPLSLHGSVITSHTRIALLASSAYAFARSFFHSTPWQDLKAQRERAYSSGVSQAAMKIQGGSVRPNLLCLFGDGSRQGSANGKLRGHWTGLPIEVRLVYGISFARLIDISLVHLVRVAHCHRAFSNVCLPICTRVLDISSYVLASSSPFVCTYPLHRSICVYHAVCCLSCSLSLSLSLLLQSPFSSFMFSFIILTLHLRADVPSHWRDPSSFVSEKRHERA